MTIQMKAPEQYFPVNHSSSHANWDFLSRSASSYDFPEA